MNTTSQKIEKLEARLEEILVAWHEEKDIDKSFALSNKFYSLKAKIARLYNKVWSELPE